MKHTQKHILKAVSSLTAFVLLLTQTAGAGVLTLPPQAGQITETFYPIPSKANDIPDIIHIRTVHMNYKVQKKIEKMLEHLTKEAGVKVIGLEGADVPIHPDRVFLTADPKIRYEAAEELAQKNLMTGAELFSIHAPKDVRIVGIEDRALYQANLSDLQYVASHRESVEKVIDDLRKRLERLEPILLGREVQEMLIHQRKFQEESDGLLTYFHFLDERAAKLGIEATPSTFPTIARLFTLEKLGDFIDKHSGEIDGEWVRFKKINKLSAEEDRHNYLAIHEIDRLNFPRLGALKNYLELTKEVNEVSYLAMDEAAALEQAVLARLVVTKNAFELVRLTYDLLDIHHLNNLSLMRERVEDIEVRLHELTFQKISERLATLEKAASSKSVIASPQGEAISDAELFDGSLVRAVSFYQMARARDQAMMKRFIGELKEGERAVIITGGFHSRGITEQIKKSGRSYAVVLPDVEELTDHKSYLQVFLGDSAFKASELAGKSQLEPALIFGDMSLAPTIISAARINLLEILSRHGVSSLNADQLSTIPPSEHVTGVTWTHQTNADGPTALNFTVGQDETSFKFSLVADHIEVGNEKIPLADIFSVPAGAGFGSGLWQKIKTTSRTVQTALLVLIASCGGVGVNFAHNFSDGSNTLGFNLPLIPGLLNVQVSIENGLYPLGEVGDIRQINTDSLSPEDILASTSWTSGPGVFPGNRGLTVLGANSNEDDLFIPEPQPAIGQFALHWTSPEDLDEMRDRPSPDGTSIQLGNYFQYAFIASSITTKRLNVLGDEPLNPDGTRPLPNADGWLFATSGQLQALDPRLPPDTVLDLILSEHLQPDGQFIVSAHPGVRFESLNEILAGTGETEAVRMSQLFASGEAIPAVQFDVSIPNGSVRTFGHQEPSYLNDQIRLEVKLSNPARVEFNPDATLVFNEADGGFTRSYRPLSSEAAYVVVEEGWSDGRVTMVLDTAMLNLPASELAIVVNAGTPFLDVDSDRDGLLDPNPDYVSEGSVIISNIRLVAAHPNVGHIPYYSKTAVAPKTDGEMNDEVYAAYLDELGNAITDYTNKAAGDDAELVEVDIENVGGFGAIPPLRISGIKNGIVRIAAQAGHILTKENAGKVVTAIGALAAAGLPICGGGGCAIDGVVVNSDGEFEIILAPIQGSDIPSVVVPLNPDNVDDNLDRPDDGFTPVPPHNVSFEPIAEVSDRLDPDSVEVTVPLTSLFSSTPFFAVSDAPVLTQKNFLDPDHTNDSGISVEWFDPATAGLSASIEPPSFAGLVFQSPDPIAPGATHTTLDYLQSIANHIRQDRSLLDAAGNLIPSVAKLADDIEAFLTLLASDEDLVPVWEIHAGLDTPRGTEVEVEFKIEGIDPQTGLTKTVASTPRILRGGETNFITLELTREILELDMRQITVVANLGNPTHLNGSINTRYVPEGRLTIIENQFLLARRDQSGNLVTYPGETQAPLIDFQPHGVVNENDIETRANINITDPYGTTFTFPEAAPPIEAVRPLFNPADIANFSVDLKLTPPSAEADLSDAVPDVNFGGRVFRLRLPEGVAVIPETGDIVVPTEDETKIPFIESFKRLAILAREAGNSTEASRWEQLAMDAEAGDHDIGIEVIASVPPPESLGASPIPIPIKLALESRDPQNPSVGLASNVSLQTLLPGVTTTVRQIIPAEWFTNPNITVDQIVFVIEAGNEYLTDASGEIIRDAEGKPVPNPTHIDRALVRVQMNIFSAKKPLEPEPQASTRESIFKALVPDAEKLLNHNPRLEDVLADALDLSPSALKALVNSYLNTGGIASYFSPAVKANYLIEQSLAVRTGPYTRADVPLLGILPTLERIAAQLDAKVKEVLGPDTNIGEVRWVTPNELAQIQKRSDIRTLEIGGVQVAVAVGRDNLVTVAATPDDAAQLRFESAVGFGIQNVLASELNLLLNGVTPNGQVTPLPSDVSFIDFLGAFASSLAKAGVSSSLASLFAARQKGETREPSIRVLTHIPTQSLRQLELDLSENPNAFYVYLDYDIGADSYAAEFIQRLTLASEGRFIRLAVPEDAKNDAGAAKYLAEFLAGRISSHDAQRLEQSFLAAVLQKLPAGKTQAHVAEFVSIAGSPELISAINREGVNKAQKLILESQTSPENQIALNAFSLRVLGVADFGEALRNDLLEPAPDAIQFNTFKPSASVMQNLGQIYAALMQAQEALSTSA